MMAECMALEEVYRLLLMSPLIRKISACAATRSARSRSLISATLNPNRPQCGFSACVQCHRCEPPSNRRGPHAASTYRKLSVLYIIEII